MRVYINKKNKLTIAPDFYEKWGSQSVTNIQVKDCKLTENIESDIENAINEIIRKYETELKKLDFKSFFEEQDKQTRESFDFSSALTDYVEGEVYGDKAC